MRELVRYEVTDTIAVLTIDNPPVNALSPGVPEAIEAAIARAIADATVDAIVLTGTGDVFVGGADIKVFETLRTPEQSIARSEGRHASLARLEDTPKPLVAAINGPALGGGLELAMACHFRIAAPRATVGQPEVALGIIPGASGTQRLPRLCGIPRALEMCTTGKPIPAAQALEAGVIDAIASGPLLADAVAFARARAQAGDTRRTRELPIPGNADEARRAIAQYRASLATSSRGVRAPLAAVDAIEATMDRDFASGLRRERELFAECVTSTASRALVHLFFAEREVSKVPGISKETPTRQIRRAAVIGAGTMGAGIAMTLANAGIPVRLTDADDAALARGLDTIRKNYESSVSRGKLTREASESTRALITPARALGELADVDIVIEAIVEDLAVKCAVFAELGRVTRADAILATNTSTLDVDAIAAASGRPHAVLGLHFFSPAHIMKLLEIVRGRATSDETLATGTKLGKTLGKVGVVVGNGFGFVGNRLLAYYRREACLLLEEGASVSQIDAALVNFGMPLGPFAMQDLAGIDIATRAKQHLATLGRTPADGPMSSVPDRLFAMGRYGQKTGAGWYRYEPGSRTPIADPLIEQLAAEAAAQRGVQRRSIDDDEIVARIMTAMANEGARVLDEGLATRASDIDVIYCHGYGYPRYRGGPMFYADTIGLNVIVQRIDDYRARFGDHWRAAPLLEQLAAHNGRFSA